MKIEVQFFSRLRDLAGGTNRALDLPAGSTVADLLGRLYTDHPAMQAWDKTLLTAVGLEFAERSQPLREGDVVAVMPPVQGG